MLSLIEERSPRLFVDSLMPIDFIITFSSLSKWYEQRIELPDRLSKTKKGESFVIEHDSISVLGDSKLFFNDLS
jgi:hypothetical protein